MPSPRSFPLPDGVDPIPGEPLRFMVSSRNQPEVQYLVDLEENRFNGMCFCDDFKYRHQPRLNEDFRQENMPMKRRCYHIKRALYYLAEVTTRLIAAKLKTK